MGPAQPASARRVAEMAGRRGRCRPARARLATTTRSEGAGVTGDPGPRPACDIAARVFRTLALPGALGTRRTRLGRRRQTAIAMDMQKHGPADGPWPGRRRQTAVRNGYAKHAPTDGPRPGRPRQAVGRMAVTAMVSGSDRERRGCAAAMHPRRRHNLLRPASPVSRAAGEGARAPGGRPGGRQGWAESRWTPGHVWMELVRGSRWPGGQARRPPEGAWPRRSRWRP
jgi:hypothetical protein